MNFVIGFGIDLCKINRISNWIDEYDMETLNYLFTTDEYKTCKYGKQSRKLFAVYFSIKESVSKALNTGMAGISWCDIEITTFFKGYYQVELHDVALTRMRQLGAKKCQACAKLIKKEFIYSEAFLYGK